VAPHAPGWIQSLTLFPVRGRGDNYFSGDNAVAKDFLVVIDVVDEGIEGVDALLKSALDVVPLAGGHNPGDQVEGKDALRTGGVAVNVEGDAHLEQQALGGVFVAQQVPVRQGFDGFEQKPGVWTRLAGGIEHLVVKAIGIV
jgi:hypothetical protein